MVELVSCFKFEVMEEGNDVFEYGERGELFYIIIKGICGVRIPNPKIKDWRNKRQDYLSYLNWVDELEAKYGRLRLARRIMLDNKELKK